MLWHAVSQPVSIAVWHSQRKAYLFVSGGVNAVEVYFINKCSSNQYQRVCLIMCDKGLQNRFLLQDLARSSAGLRDTDVLINDHNDAETEKEDPQVKRTCASPLPGVPDVTSYQRSHQYAVLRMTLAAILPVTELSADTKQPILATVSVSSLHDLVCSTNNGRRSECEAMTGSKHRRLDNQCYRAGQSRHTACRPNKGTRCLPSVRVKGVSLPETR